jgi:hypothetical protein
MTRPESPLFSGAARFFESHRPTKPTLEILPLDDPNSQKVLKNLDIFSGFQERERAFGKIESTADFRVAKLAGYVQKIFVVGPEKYVANTKFVNRIPKFISLNSEFKYIFQTESQNPDSKYPIISVADYNGKLMTGKYETSSLDLNSGGSIASVIVATNQEYLNYHAIDKNQIGGLITHSVVLVGVSGFGKARFAIGGFTVLDEGKCPEDWKLKNYYEDAAVEDIDLVKMAAALKYSGK